MALSQERTYSKRSTRKAARPQAKQAKVMAKASPRQASKGKAAAPSSGKGPEWASKDWQQRAMQRAQTPVRPDPWAAERSQLAAWNTEQKNYAQMMGAPAAQAPRMPAVPGYSAGMPLWQQALLGTLPQTGNMGGGMTMGTQAPRGQRARLPGQTLTTMPDAYNAVPRQPWWATPAGRERTGQDMTTRDWAKRAISKNYMAGSIAKPDRISGIPEGYADGGAAPDAGGSGDWWDSYGSGGYGGYSYPDYGGGSYGGGAYAQPMQEGYNPQNAQTPRWWHNRLSWRF